MAKICFKLQSDVLGNSSERVVDVEVELKVPARVRLDQALKVSDICTFLYRRVFSYNGAVILEDHIFTPFISIETTEDDLTTDECEFPSGENLLLEAADRKVSTYNEKIRS